MFFVLGGALRLNLLILGLRLGALGVHFEVFLRLQGQTLDPFFHFLEKVPKGTEKVRKRELELMHFHRNFEFSQKVNKCVSTTPARAD